MDGYRISRPALAAALMAAVAIGIGCSDDTPVVPATQTYKGAETPVGAGVAWTELVFDGDALQSMRVAFTRGALDDLPPTLPTTEYVIPLPANAPATVFDHVTINWQPEGHPPPMVYTHPHFDVHYYLVSIAERNAMTPADPSYAGKIAAVPAATDAPPRYSADPQGVPRMGTHWTNIDSHEFHGSPFTHTMVYGFYDAKMVFIEPMLTRAFLLTRPDVTADIQVPQRYPKPGRYPAKYRVYHQAAGDEYRVELLDFRDRN